MNDVDHTLRRRVQEVGNQVAVVSEQVGLVSSQVRTVQANQDWTRSELRELRDEFLAFVQASQQVAHVQRAETRIVAVQDRLDHEFGHHKKVRRTAVGLLQAFDVGLVSEETVRTVTEQLMIQTPRYWLAPALVALASWSADDPQLCERGIDEAYSRSPGRTSLFFALVLRRQGRADGSVRWLEHYLGSQDPDALGREFGVILEAVAQGAFGAAARDLLSRTLLHWQARAADGVERQEAHDAQTRRWRAEIDSLRPASAAAEFPLLSAVSPQWGLLDGALVAARTQRQLLDKYRGILGAVPLPSQRMEDAVDDILDQLVSEYDDDELPLRRELALMEAIVRHDGDLAAASPEADTDLAALAETLDLLTFHTTAALDPEAIGVSSATRRLAVGVCREWFLRAHGGFTRDYRAAVPQEVQARFQADHTVGARNFRLPPWTGSFLRPLDELESSLAGHWDQHTAPYIASFRYPLVRRSLPAVVVVLAVLLVLGQAHTGAALVVAPAIGLVWWLRIHRDARAAARHRDQATELLAGAKADSLLQLRAASAELSDWNAGYQDADEVEAGCSELIDSLATVTDNGSPYAGRTVPGEDGPE
ncbi:hypothetical protein [Streptomyces sp. NPDC057287]|uniref:hypothetical protein n=1 Tax=Streptomyces sp. NPDC057287 TaxID=3346086 RepID=UPI00362E9C56